MAFTGGDIIEITFNHEDIGSGTLYCKSNEDGTMKLGGYESNDDDNEITGDGQLIDQMNRVRASFEVPPIAWDMTARDDFEKLNDLESSSKLADWTISHVSGAIYAGKGKPVGEITGDTNTAQITCKLVFQNKLRKI